MPTGVRSRLVNQHAGGPTSRPPVLIVCRQEGPIARGVRINVADGRMSLDRSSVPVSRKPQIEGRLCGFDLRDTFKDVQHIGLMRTENWQPNAHVDASQG